MIEIRICKNTCKYWNICKAKNEGKACNSYETLENFYDFLVPENIIFVNEEK